MATSTSSSQPSCSVCSKEKRTFVCDGCSRRFCRVHLDEHQEILEKEFDQIETRHDVLRERINAFEQDPMKHPLMIEINEWENISINIVKRTAHQAREKFLRAVNPYFPHLIYKLNYLAQQIKEIRREEFNDQDIQQLTEKLNQLEKELVQPTDLVIERQPTALVDFVSLRIPSGTQNYA